MSTIDYEGMFLLDNNAATADFEATSGQVNQLLEKHGMEVVRSEKWDERKLAYEINGHRRATYYLVHFRGPAGGQDPITEDLGLTEQVLRHLILKLEVPIEEHIANYTRDAEAMAEDSRRNSLSGWGRRDKRKGDKDAKPAEGGSAEGASSDAPAAEGAKPAEAKASTDAETPAAPAADEAVKPKPVGATAPVPTEDAPSETPEG